MVVGAYHGVLGVPGHIHHLGCCQEVWGQQGQGQVGLDESPVLSGSGLQGRQGDIVRVVPQGIALQEGEALHELHLAALQVQAMGHLPHQLLGEGGATLGEAHNPDVAGTHLQSLHPVGKIRSNINSPTESPETLPST